MKVWRIITIILLCLVLAGSVACNPFAPVKEQITWQQVKVTRGDLTVSVSGSGKLEISDEANLGFGVSGRVEEIFVEENDTVKKGEVLAELDTGALELAVTQAQVARAQAELALAEAQAALDEARYDLDILQRRHVSYEQQRVAKLQISAIEQQIQTAELQIKQAEQSIPEAQKQLEWATIVAPFAGIVNSVAVDEGDTVVAGQSIVHLIDITNLELKIDVDEIDIPQVKIGQRVIIEVDALPDVSLEGGVASISPLSKEESGLVLYEVTVALTVLEGFELRAGMSATGNIVIDERSDVLLLPNRAVVEDNQGNTVVKVAIGEQIEEKPIVAGISDGLQTEILDGLEEGDVALIEIRTKPAPAGGFFGGSQ